MSGTPSVDVPVASGSPRRAIHGSCLIGVEYVMPQRQCIVKRCQNFCRGINGHSFPEHITHCSLRSASSGPPQQENSEEPTNFLRRGSGRMRCRRSCRRLQSVRHGDDRTAFPAAKAFTFLAHANAIALSAAFAIEVEAGHVPAGKITQEFGRVVVTTTR